MKQTIELLAAAGIAALVTITYIILVGRELGPAEYSEFSTALSFIYFFAIALSPVTPAMARVVARRVARGEEYAVPEFRRRVMRVLMIAAVAATPVLLLGAIGFSRALRFESPAPLILAFASALAFSLLSADRGVLQGLFRFRVYSASILLESVLRLAVTLAVLRVSPSPSGALIGYLIGIVMAEVVVLPFVGGGGKLVNGVPAIEWDELRRLVVPMLILMVTAAVYQNIDMMAVKRWFSAVTAGQYGAALALARMFGVIFTPLYVLSGPILTRHHELGEPLTAPALRIAATYLALCGAALMALFLRGEEIVGLLFGQGFAPGGWVVPHLGLVSTLMHTSLLLAQVFITVHDFTFLRFFVVAAVIQGVGLALFHGTISGVLASLYAAQLALIIPLSLRLARYSRTHEIHI